MTDSEENKSVDQQGTWATPPHGKEAQLTNAFFDDLLIFKSKIRAVFGDSSLFASIDSAINRVCELWVFTYINNTVKSQWAGNTGDRERAREFSDFLYQGLLREMPRMLERICIDSSDVLDLVLSAAGRLEQ